MSWTPEMNEMVRALSKAEMLFRQKEKRAWSRANIADQAEYLLRALRSDGYDIAQQSTILTGKHEQNRIAEERRARGVKAGAPDPDGITGVA